MGEFSLKIELGNEGMQTPRDVGMALGYLSEILVENSKITMSDRGAIVDANGNTVGTWRFIP